LTQAALAERAGLTQQRIQRMEAEVGPLRVEQLDQVARALDVTLSDLVPGLGREDKRPRKSRRRSERDVEPVADPFAGLIEPAEMERRTLRVCLVGGHEISEIFYGQDYERIVSILRDGDKPWICLDGVEHSIAIRTDMIETIRIYADSVGDFRTEDAVESEKSHEEANEEASNPEWLDAYYRSGRRERHSIIPDHGNEYDDSLAEGGVDYQNRRLFYDLDSIDADADRGDGTTVSFWDDDEDEVFLNYRQLVAVVTPLTNTNPSLDRAVFEGMEEEGKV
jgi:transcriptional regulator with XRE-family HTH domain